MGVSWLHEGKIILNEKQMQDKINILIDTLLG
jgi:hypothetical protein